MTLSASDLEISDFDAAELLTDEETIAAYLTASFASGDQAELLQALNTVARARGMTELSRKTGIQRESLYRTLSGSSQPRFDTIAKISSALGVAIEFTPKVAY
ncbi:MULTISPECIES: addiction module antidote protein [unclassified Lonepinella]|uniref:addiction module antidote protein n=1 Tax=unclassified Lonepinella TaxID=2642006 RepID=UPI0036DA3BC7